MVVLLPLLEFYVFYLHILHTCCNLLSMRLMRYEGKCEGSVKDVKVRVGDQTPKIGVLMRCKVQKQSEMRRV